MKTYRFEISAYEEIDVNAKSLNEAIEKAEEYWDKTFKDKISFGDVTFVKEVEDD